MNDKSFFKEDSPSLPEAIDSSRLLNENRLNTASHNLLLLDTISELLKKMHENKIQIMLLKGAALLENIYGDISQRKMEDVDILVKPEKLDEVRELLTKTGYRFYGTNQANSEVYDFDASIKIYLDLHWRLVNQNSPSQKYVYWPDENLIWERAVTIDMGKLPVLGMCVEDLLIYLCFHALKERFSQKKWLKDIKMILRIKKDEIDWDKLTSIAKDSGADKLCCFIMEYLRKESTVAIPESVLSQIKKIYPFYSLERDVFHLSVCSRMFLKELLWPLSMNNRKKQLLFFKSLPAYLWKKICRRVFIKIQ